MPHSSSVTSLTFLVETPSTYISIKAKHERLLVPLVAREKARAEVAFSVLGHE